MKIDGKEKRATHWDMIVIVLIGLLLFLTIALAARMYGRVIARQDSRDTARRQLAAIAGRLHNADGAARVTLRATRYGRALVIAENTDSGVVETRYFKADDRLYEQTALAADAVSTKRATSLAKTRVFRVAIAGDLVTVTTDAGTAHITLRGGTGT